MPFSNVPCYHGIVSKCGHVTIFVCQSVQFKNMTRKCTGETECGNLVLMKILSDRNLVPIINADIQDFEV